VGQTSSATQQKLDELDKSINNDQTEAKIFT